MADAIIMRARKSLSNPRPDADHIMYSDQRLLVSLRAADAVSVGEGGAVNSLIARGHGRLEERTFGLSESWLGPTLSLTGANGRPSLKFNKSHQLANRSRQTEFPQIRVQPLVYMAVCRVTEYGPGNDSARIIGGSNTQLGNMTPNAATNALPRISFSAGASVIRDIIEGTGWAVHIMVVNGVNSLLKVGQRAVDTFDLGTQGNNALHIGGNVSANVNAGLKGEVAEINLLQGALTASEVNTWYNFLTSKYGIA